MITRAIASVKYKAPRISQGLLNPKTGQPYANEIDQTNRKKIHDKLMGISGVSHADVGKQLTIITYFTSLDRNSLEEKLHSVFACWAVDEGYFPKECYDTSFFTVEYLDDLVT